MSTATAAPSIVAEQQEKMDSKTKLDNYPLDYPQDPVSLIPTTAANGRTLGRSSDKSSTDSLNLSPPMSPLPSARPQDRPLDPFSRERAPQLQPYTTSNLTSPSLVIRREESDISLSRLDDDESEISLDHPLQRHSTEYTLTQSFSKKINNSSGFSLSRHNTTGHGALMAQSGHANGISKELERELHARRKVFRRLSMRKKEGEEEDRVVIGTRIGEDHQNYVLMYNMLTGIRTAVGRVSAKIDRQLTDEDFTAAHKLAFDITGDELTPGAKYDFKFKDYAPWVFRHLREKFGIDPADYLMSLTNNYILSELGSPGKSGSFFYYSRDYRFIIKTIHHTEHKFMRKILREYHDHVNKNPDTLLCRYYGLHRVKLPRGRKIHFVVMGNVFPPNKDVHEIFDLKGSTIGRFLPEEEVLRNPMAVMKDLNWEERGRKLALGPTNRRLFIDQLVRDVKLLVSLNIMDYSLLVGVHDMLRGNTDNVRDSALQFFKPDTEQVKRSATMMNRRQSRAQVRKAIQQANPNKLDSSELPKDPVEERRYCIFYRDEGGFQATDKDDMPKPTLYFLGIIDILTPYDLKKKSEHMVKSFVQDKRAISAVKPSDYGDRFMNFMSRAITHNGDIATKYHLNHRDSASSSGRDSGISSHYRHHTIQT